MMRGTGRILLAGAALISGVSWLTLRRFGDTIRLPLMVSDLPGSVRLAITSIRVLKAEEDSRFGQEPFLKQFTGKTFKDPFKIGTDLKAVSGEEVLSQTFAGEVRKALWIVQAVFAKK